MGRIGKEQRAWELEVLALTKRYLELEFGLASRFKNTKELQELYKKQAEVLKQLKTLFEGKLD